MTQKFSQKAAQAAGLAGIFALSAFTALPHSARAQQTVAANSSGQVTSGRTSVRQAINRFADAYGTPIIQRGALNGSSRTTLTLGSSRSVQAREADIASLADAAGAGWHRMFFVAPASSTQPVTTYADAKNLTTATGRISLQLKHLPLDAAAHAFARAAGSEVTLMDGSDTQPTSLVTIPAANLTAAQVIARMAAQTKTHWTVGYVLQPLTASELAQVRRNRDASGSTVAIADRSTTGRAASTDSRAYASHSYASTPYQGGDLNGNPYNQVANAIPDGYDQNGNPYFIAPQGNGSNSSFSSTTQTPYALGNGYGMGGYPGYYGDSGLGGFTTTSPTYYGYGYGPGTNPYAAGITQNASPFNGGFSSGLGLISDYSTVFSSGGVGTGTGPTTLTP